MDGSEKSGLCGSVWWLCVPQLFQQFTHFVQFFFMKFVCQLLCCVSLQIQTFYQHLVLVAEYHADC